MNETVRIKRPILETFADGDAIYFFRGRVALYWILRALGVCSGDEVVLQAFTCLAVPSPVLAIGATPRFIDISSETLNMDPTQLDRAIGPRTRAIVVQHTFGRPADMTTIMAIANDRQVPVIEDCSHTLMSSIGSRQVGSFGVASFYSFEWGKPLIAGVGGAAVLNHDELRTQVLAGFRTCRTPSASEQIAIEGQFLLHALTERSPLFWQVRDAYRVASRLGGMVGSFRPEELGGAASPDFFKRIAPHAKSRVLTSISQMPADAERRKRLAKHYQVELDRTTSFDYRPTVADDNVVWLKLPLRVANKQRLLSEARRRHVELYDMFATPVHPLAKSDWRGVGYEEGACLNAESASQQIVSLPLHSKVGRRGVVRALDLLRDVAEWVDT